MRYSIWRGIGVFLISAFMGFVWALAVLWFSLSVIGVRVMLGPSVWIFFTVTLLVSVFFVVKIPVGVGVELLTDAKKQRLERCIAAFSFTTAYSFIWFAFWYVITTLENATF